ncbi:MAG: RHS repeat protein [Dehalococcoidia bacterium]|nr:RHS repeat protein [Dehalococcoidia bacterium]
MTCRDGRPGASITYPGGSNQVTHGYDNANRLTSVTDWNSNSTTYSYDDAGRMTSTTLPSGTVAIDTEGCEVGNVGCHERAGGYMGCTWTTPQSCDLAPGIYPRGFDEVGGWLRGVSRRVAVLSLEDLSGLSPTLRIRTATS